LLRGERSLLLRECSLRGSLRLPVLLAMSLVDGLCDGLTANSLSHLGSLALPGVNRTDEPALCLRRSFA
jgi:hypothetical protein